MTRAHDQACPVAASLNQLGDMWTLMIVREAFKGATRFGDFQRQTGIAKTLLTTRLGQMVDDGILSRHDIGQNGVRHEYRLTTKGKALSPVMIALSQWGNAWLFDAGNEPATPIHRKTGEPIAPLRPATLTGEWIDWRDVQMRRNPRPATPEE